jgi:ABC-2 type transport system permease protein
MTLITKPLAFLYRDFLNDASYKSAFAAQILRIVLSVITFYFLSRLFSAAINPYLKPYGGDYFAFVLIGLAFADYLTVALYSFAGTIREGQMLGTLEAVLVTQTEIPVAIFCSSLYSFFMTSLRVVVFLLAGTLLFGFDMARANLWGALIILFLTIIAFSSLGIMSASYVILLKKGNPLNWIFGNLSWVLGGVFYPISILPDWVQHVSYFLPITHSLEGMRMAIIKGHSLRLLAPNIVPLLVFACVVWPLSLWLFQYAIKRAKIDGSLTHY